MRTILMLAAGVAIVGVTVFALVQPNSTTATPGTAAALANPWETAVWKVICERKYSKACGVSMSLEGDAKSKARVKGRYGTIRIGFGFDFDMSNMTAHVEYHDQEVTRFRGAVEITSARIDGAAQPFTCSRGYDCKPADIPRLVNALRHGKVLALELRGRDPVEIDIRGFGQAWAQAEKEAAALR